MTEKNCPILLGHEEGSLQEDVFKEMGMNGIVWVDNADAKTLTTQDGVLMSC